MTIEKKYLSNSKQIQPGEHVVKITDYLVGLSKAGKPMLTLTFENAQGQSIKGYYVKDLKFHTAQLNDLKLACGLTKESSAEDLFGKTCGICVEPQEPNEHGNVFMRIVGVGKASDVTDNFGTPPPAKAAPEAEQKIPF